MKTLTVKQVESPILRQDSNQKFQELHKENENLRAEIVSLKKMTTLLEHRNHEFLKNEIQYRSVIKSYQIELKKKLSSLSTFIPENTEKSQVSITEYHKELNENIEKLQRRVDEILTVREETLVAVYNSKLKDINNTLEKEKKEKFEYLEGLAEREHMLSKELQMLKGSVGVIEEKNFHLEKENRELKHTIKIKNLEIGELQKRMFEIKEKSIYFPKIKTSRADPHSKSQKGIKTASLAIETDFVEDDISGRYQKIISKLQKLLAIEKNNVRAARNAYFTELNNKSEIEECISNCIEEVKKERKNAKKGAFSLTYNMSLVEKLVNNEKIIEKIKEFMTHKCEVINE